MMKKVFTFLLVILIGGNCILYAQSYKTHTVKEDETVATIAKMYNVTPYNIYKYNPEVRTGLTIGTVLVISSERNLPDQILDSVKKQPKKTVADEKSIRKPLHFEHYKVRRRDGYLKLYRLFGVSEQDIKRYNKELYAQPLKKGMMLRIPIYPKTTETDTQILDTLQIKGEVYVVKPKETRWSIAHRYNITVDSLQKLNPEMGEIVVIGQELNVPVTTALPLSTQGEKEPNYLLYTVPSKENFFQLKQKYQVTKEQLIQANPQLDSLGLREGMVLRIPEIKEDLTAINASNFMFYEVQPKDNFFRLKMKLGYAEQELRGYNPSINERNGLHPGMILKLPRKDVYKFNVRNSRIVESFDLVDSISLFRRPSVALMLPFKTKNMDWSAVAQTKKYLKNNKPVKYSLGLYTGALVALDSLKSLGLSVDLKVLDTQGSVQEAKKLLYTEDLSNIQAVIGPLFNSVFSEIATALKEKDIPVFAPISSGGKTNLDNVFYTRPNKKVSREKITNYIQSYKTDQELIVFVDPNELEEITYLKQKFPTATFFNLDKLKKPFDEIRNNFDPEKKYWVLVHTKKMATLSSWINIINALNSDKIKMTLFAYEKDQTFDFATNTSLSKLNFHFASPTILSSRQHPFAKRYRQKFGKEPDKYAARGFDLMMDVVLRLAYKDSMDAACAAVGETSYVESKFNYNRYLFSSYYNEGVYVLKYQDLRIVEVVPLVGIEKE